MTAVQEIAVRLCIVEALGSKYFNICGVTKAAEVLELPIHVSGSNAWKVMSALHMKEWAKMTPEGSEQLVQIVGEALGLSLIDRRAPDDGSVRMDPQLELLDGREYRGRNVLALELVR